MSSSGRIRHGAGEPGNGSVDSDNRSELCAFGNPGSHKWAVGFMCEVG